MKKILLFFCALAYTFIVYADPVSQQAALMKASQFMPGKTFLMANVAESGKKGPNGGSPYFVFNAEDNGGFVIVSGDDRTKPILGYSEKGSIKENALPDNVEWLLDYYSKVVSSLDGIPFDAGSNSTTATIRSTISPLIKTNWNQHSPWNDLCVFDGVQCVTGCVATAMAQIVNYYKYPDKVSAMDAYTATWSGKLFPALPETTLNWTNMTNNDMAKLCRYCGQSVEMDYGENGSSATSELVSLALVKYFSYSKSTHAIYRDGYSPEGWENEIYQELVAGYPVLYSGRSITNSGHAFIVDGYENGLFHVNWGWGGYCNGHFVLTVMDSHGPEYPSWTFSEEQSAIVGVRPVQGGTLDYPLMTISQLELASGSELTRSSSSEDFNPKISFKADNSVNEDNIACGIGFALFKGNEMVQGLLQFSPSQKRPGWYNYGTYNIRFGAGLDDGTYRIEAVYLDNDGIYHQAQGFGYRYVEAVLQGNSLTLTNYPLTKLKLSKTELTIAKGQSEVLTATCPSSWSNKKVTWESSDTNVATVSSKGKVKGVGVGTATITCTSAMGPKASCEVTVGQVVLNKTKAIVAVGKTRTLKATVYPETLEDKSVTWKSSDTKVATVTSAGKVKGVGVGTATITCTSNATGLSATCTLTVGKVVLNKTKAIVAVGKTRTLKATVYPETLEDKSVTWESSDTKVATVTSAGKVKGVGVGTATITCTSNATGLSATCTVTVGKVVLNVTEATVAVGKSGTLKATVYPETLEDKSVTWESSDTEVATVTSAGKVKAVGVGTATITCTSNATGLSATCILTVGKVVLNKTKVIVAVGKTRTLKATVYPETLEDKSVTWKSSDTKVATVTSAGKVTGVSEGTATITCTSNATGLKATCTLTVTATANTRSLGGGDDDFTGFEDIDVDPAVVEPFDVYDTSGHKVRHQVTSLDGLPNGVYIVNGKKVLKK